MYSLCVSGALNTQGFEWKLLCTIYKLSVIHLGIQTLHALSQLRCRSREEFQPRRQSTEIHVVESVRFCVRHFLVHCCGGQYCQLTQSEHHEQMSRCCQLTQSQHHEQMSLCCQLTQNQHHEQVSLCCQLTQSEHHEQMLLCCQLTQNQHHEQMSLCCQLTQTITCRCHCAVSRHRPSRTDATVLSADTKRASRADVTVLSKSNRSSSGKGWKRSQGESGLVSTLICCAAFSPVQ